MTDRQPAEVKQFVLAGSNPCPTFQKNMNIEQIIKKIEKLGLKEYKTSSLEHYDRAWQTKINNDLFVNVNFWEHSKLNNFVKDSFEIEVYKNNDDGAERVMIYGFSNFDKAYKKALEYIKFLK